MTEIWKPIKGYERLYEVSNLGNVKSLVKEDSNNQYGKEEIIRVPHITIWGYKRVTLSKNGKQKSYVIHRLVAEAFIPNPDNLPCVNHKDEDKTNNRVDNLEWCTASYNVNYGTAIQRRIEKIKRKINQYTLDMHFVKEWDSIKDAVKSLGIQQANISNCCLKKRHKAGGYKWFYDDDQNQYIDQPLF